MEDERTAPERLPERFSVRDQVLGALRAAIIGGELPPGSVQSAPALAGRYGVSATPVREAMQVLALEGAVEVLPNRGFRITERSSCDLAELAEVRALLEVPVLLSLIPVVPAARWEELRPLAEETVEVASRGDRVAYAEADRGFHRALLALSGNRQLVEFADGLHRRAQWPPSGALPRGRSRAEPLLAHAGHHGQLLTALAQRDAPRAEVLTRTHLTATL